MWTGSQEIEKYLLTTGEYSKKIFFRNGNLIALKAAQNYKMLYENKNAMKELSKDIIDYYRKLFEQYNDKILQKIIDLDNKANVILKLKIHIYYAKYKIIKYLYKKFYKLKNM